MKDVLSAIIPLTLMAQGMHERMSPTGEVPETTPQPPWVKAKYNIPKSIRKGKTWEEILEIKKQIWIEEQLTGDLLCLKCGKTKKQDDDTETTKFFLTLNGVLCENCVETQEKGGKNE